jgi:hypothetical protein
MNHDNIEIKKRLGQKKDPFILASLILIISPGAKIW